MRRTLAGALIAVVALGVAMVAQGTRVDEFGRRLRLNDREQRPKLDPIFAAAGAEAGPVAQEMMTLRLQMVNLALNNQPAEMAKVRAAYKAAAAKVAGIETKVLSDVYAFLEPRQHERVADAFEFMAGFFQMSVASPARGGRGQ